MAVPHNKMTVRPASAAYGGRPTSAAQQKGDVPGVGDVLGGDEDEGVSVTINLRMPGGPAPPSLKLQQQNASAARKRMERLSLGGTSLSNDSLIRPTTPGSLAARGASGGGFLATAGAAAAAARGGSGGSVSYGGAGSSTPSSSITAPTSPAWGERRALPDSPVPNGGGGVGAGASGSSGGNGGSSASAGGAFGGSGGGAAAPGSFTAKALEAQGIALEYDPSATAVPLPLTGISNGGAKPRAVSVDVGDLPKFLMAPGPRNGAVQCYITREKGTTKFFPRYRLFLEDGRRFLVAARKRKKSSSSNYCLSLDPEDQARDSKAYFGKVQSNFVGTEFTIFDGGARQGQGNLGEPERAELAAVQYQYNLLGTRGPRRMTVALPAIDNSGRQLYHQGGPDEGLPQRLNDAVVSGVTPADITVLRNKPPRWNEQLQAYCLNFNGRVTEASVKNFQLVADHNPEAVIVQFGKVGESAFSMDFSWPISALQAFAICVSSFDNKLACE